MLSLENTFLKKDTYSISPMSYQTSGVAYMFISEYLRIRDVNIVSSRDVHEWALIITDPYITHSAIPTGEKKA